MNCQTQEKIEVNGKEFILLGTAHVSEASIKEVEQVIEEQAPDVIAVELDETRYESYVEFVSEAIEYKEKIKYNGVKKETSHKFKNNKVQAKISDKKRQASRNTRKQMIYKEIEENADE